MNIRRRTIENHETGEDALDGSQSSSENKSDDSSGSAQTDRYQRTDYRAEKREILLLDEETPEHGLFTADAIH